MQTNSAKLNSNAQAVVIATVFGDEGAVGIVEMEMPCELIVRGLAREAPVSSSLIFGKKADGHPQAGFKLTPGMRARLPSNSAERGRGCP